jgi:AraC-like DNA-binding protein
VEWKSHDKFTLMESGKHRKPILLRDQFSLDSSFILKENDLVSNNPWHFHPEVELFCCNEARGTNFIGNYVHSLEKGELLLIGKNLPHSRQVDKTYDDKKEISGCIELKFREDFLGSNFFMLKEFAHIDALLKRAQKGIKFQDKTRGQVYPILQRIKGATGVTALMSVLSILDILARADDFSLLNSAGFLNEPNHQDSQKINKVFLYTEEHFREPIALSEVAALINITEAAFCRYFKVRTGKSYFQYLTEFRIFHACRMLLEEDKDIAQVCFSSGFNNPSNFHKQFKKIVNLTPKAYRENGKKRVPSG